jgi:transcriptional regulator with XRE-family HTH domain
MGMAGIDHTVEPYTNHLGALVRSRRRELGLTQAELAARIEKSPSYISALESGSVAPSLTTLRHIAAALDTVVGFFFEQPGNSGRAEPPSGGRLRVVHPATRKVLIDPARGNVRWELLSPDLQRQMEVVQMTMEPGASVGEEEWLIHAGEECGIVLSGALEVEFERETFALARGDSLYFPSTRPHRIRNTFDGPTTAIWIITPPSF